MGHQLMYTGWAKMTGLFFKVCNSRIYVDIGQRFMYQTVQFFNWSKTDVSCVTVFKYYLRNFIVISSGPSGVVIPHEAG